MSEGLEPELTEPEATAAEHALGVLTGPERAQAEARMVADPVFAGHVEAWRIRLAPLANEVKAVTPPAGLWPRIEAALPANDNRTAPRGLGFWRGATVASLGLAAASLVVAVMIASRPPTVITPPPPAPVLNARLDTPAGLHLFVAAYDPDRQALRVTSLVPPGADPAHVHQLWLIPADGRPRSLGLVAPGTSVSLPVAPALGGLAVEGAAVAVSVEPPGGSKLDHPSGPVAAVGKLSKI
jgi:anti-sigma-K factor RskA